MQRLNAAFGRDVAQGDVLPAQVGGYHVGNAGHFLGEFVHPLGRDTDGETGAAVAAGGIHAAVIAVLILHVAAQTGDLSVQGFHQSVQIFGLGGHIHGDDPFAAFRQHGGIGVARQSAVFRFGTLHIIVSAIRRLGGGSCGGGGCVEGLGGFACAAASGQQSGKHTQGYEKCGHLFHLSYLLVVMCFCPYTRQIAAKVSENGKFAEKFFFFCSV